MIEIIKISPDPKLKRFINRISIFKSKNIIEYKHKLTPSAFTYLSYNHADIPTSIFGNNKILPDRRLQIAGPKINEDIWVHYSGRLAQVLIEFRASGFYYLFHKSPAGLKNNLTGLNNLIPSLIYDKLHSELVKQTDMNSTIEFLNAFLIELSYKSLPKVNYIERGISIIEDTRGNVSITKLADKIGISKRQFDRKFQEVVGVSAKFFGRIMQLNHVLNIICSKNYSSIQDLAFQGEFYDLPHFLRTFKKLTGLTPSEFIKSDRHLAMKYFNEE